MNSHSHKQILREGLFPSEKNLCPPVFTLPPACLVIFLPAGSFPVAYLLADWKAFKLKCGTTGVPCLTTNKASPWPTHLLGLAAFSAPGPCILPHRSWLVGRLMGRIFFSSCLLGIFKREKQNKQNKTPKLYVLHHNTLSGRMTYFYLMTLFINCLFFPIKIRNWGRGKKSLNFGFKFLGSLFFGKMGLGISQHALLEFPC